MTPNKEDYLKCIYELGNQDFKVTNKLIAEVMGVSAPATSEMMKKLLADNFIEKDKVKGYKLKGTSMAIVSDLVRKHRLIELFLFNHLGYTFEQVHAEAEVLEHVVSDLFVDKLEHILGYPRICPHGGIVPRKEEILEELIAYPLDKVTVGQSYRIKRVIDNIDLLRYLENNHLKIGTEFFFSEKDDFTGIYTISLGTQSIQMTHAVAKQIYVDAV
ncbi:MarR family transcriptional regulator [Granulicatella sp. zg-ZJ]|uniref:metal-dependent transcriptional regulator n=1 Tax=unclassified Granulicatella TaxID=2630493 RepID=UPI0013C04DA6|nr:MULTISPECIES: metal-dependent transcriptional regulator [unclassified Granulicatella]MBS4750095.1 metal-dependent transcriptional regulator [Carnobacteriaceae bacterium zg-ZUI78]NEW63105.1 MarR family transcriptional regulator [Granulicatella sp. zg-ZJ]NEW66606.1 MarR family transcriptional regulator [Granulicatella sp. zg-84]QMI86257.1 metal-dependent transcriptional regulator [Carnobacteriaceae bacterium zg-84]